MKKLKNRDYVLIEGCIGQVTNARTNQECYTIKWEHNPANQHYYQSKGFAEHCEVLPKDVAENLIAVLTKE